MLSYSTNKKIDDRTEITRDTSPLFRNVLRIKTTTTNSIVHNINNIKMYNLYHTLNFLLVSILTLNDLE